MGLKRTLRFGKSATLGLDIGSSAVKMVVLDSSKSGYAVTGAGIARIEKVDPANGDRRSNTMKAIRECFAQMQTKVKYAVCSVSGQDVALRDFEFAPLQGDEITAAVSLEASQVCPFNVTDIAVDYQVIPSDEAKTKGVLVAATNTIVAEKSQLVRDAGLKCVLMDVDGLALLNCYNASVDADPEHPSEKAIAILNVGASRTTLAIMDTNGWPFIRDLSQAGDDILMQMAALNDTSAETIRNIMFDDRLASEFNMQNSLAKTCQPLITNIAGTLRYYAAQGSSANIEKIYVCGGFALAEGFVDLLNSRLGIEAMVWNPFDQKRIKSNRRFEEICTKNGPAMAIATGLAMRTLS